MCQPKLADDWFPAPLTEEEMDRVMAGVPYVPTADDLDAQAAADADQRAADADYRELARLVVRVVACRCGEPDCLACRVASHLARKL